MPTSSGRINGPSVEHYESLLGDGWHPAKPGWSPPQTGRTGGASLFGLSGRRLRGLGIVLVIIGIALFIGGASTMMSGATSPQPVIDRFQQAPGHAMTGFALAGIGIVSLAVGSWALRLGLIRPVSRFLAEEASPAIVTASAAIGRGFTQAGLTMPAPVTAPGAQTVVKVKCKNCGHLNEESARFCDACGQTL